MMMSECNWSGHLWLPGGGAWGQHMCLRCGLIRQVIGPVTNYLWVRPQ